MHTSFFLINGLFLTVALLMVGKVIYDYLNGEITGAKAWFYTIAFSACVLVFVVAMWIGFNQDPVSQYHHNEYVEPIIMQSSHNHIEVGFKFR